MPSRHATAALLLCCPHHHVLNESHAEAAADSSTNKQTDKVAWDVDDRVECVYVRVWRRRCERLLLVLCTSLYGVHACNRRIIKN